MKEKDYSGNYRYEYDSDTTLWDGREKKAGETVEVNDIPVPGTIIKVTVEGKGNYKNVISCTYEIKNATEELQEELEESRKETLESQSQKESYDKNSFADEDTQMQSIASVEVLEKKLVLEDAAGSGNESKPQEASKSQEKEEGRENSNNDEMQNQMIISSQTEKAELSDGIQKTTEEKAEYREVELKELQQTEEQLEWKHSFKNRLEGNFHKLRKILKGVENESVVFSQKTNFVFTFFILLGCAISSYCVIMIIRKRKKGE